MRFGVVMGKDGGALSKMVPAFRKFAGGPLGSGNHWFPWIHMDDLVAAIEFIINNDDINGPVNFVSPGAVRHRQFAKALGSVLKRPSFMPAPGFMIRMILGEMGKALMSSQLADPVVLQTRGFPFRFPDIDSALKDSAG